MLQEEAWGGVLRFSDVLDEAISASLDLRMADKSIEISKSGYDEAFAEYYPTINLTHDAQYELDLSDKPSSSGAQVGEAFLPNSTRFENALGLGLQYTVYDFGIRQTNIDINTKDVEQKKLEYSKNLRDLKLQVAAVYTKALLLQQERITNQELLRLHTRIFALQEKLHAAGTSPKTILANQALTVARVTNKIDEIGNGLASALEELSYYTGTRYERDSVELQPLSDVADLEAQGNDDGAALKSAETPSGLDEQRLAEHAIFQLEIEKKRHELDILEKQNWPIMRLSSNYYWYGSDTDHFDGSLTGLEERSMSVRLATIVPLFDGFKNSAKKQKLQLEIERLKLEEEQKVKQLKLTYQQALAEWNDLAGRLGNQRQTLRLTQEKLDMLERLRQQELIDEVSYVGQKSELLNQRLELEKVRFQGQLAGYKLQVMNGITQQETN